MKIGPRYKKARYLGAPIFRKTQTQKFAMRSQAKAGPTKGRRPGAKSEYGKQMLEKQKARYSYGVAAGQFSRYVQKALSTPGNNAKNLLRLLESRLDNVALRAGLTLSRAAARQMVSHGHLCVNGSIVTVPSYSVRIGDVITIREGSKSKAIFAKLDETIKETKHPSWMKFDGDAKQITIEGEPQAEESELLFDLGSVLEFYTR